jgi:hypothetical protein
MFRLGLWVFGNNTTEVVPLPHHIRDTGHSCGITRDTNAPCLAKVCLQIPPLLLCVPFHTLVFERNP